MAEIARKNIDIKREIKNAFEEIAKEMGADDYKRVTLLAVLREALLRLVTLWWLHKHGGRLFVEKRGEPQTLLVDKYGITSINPTTLKLNSSSDEKIRINLSMPPKLLEKIEEIAHTFNKSSTEIIRDAFSIDLFLHEVKNEGGESYILLPSGKRFFVVKEERIHNPSPRDLTRFDEVPPDSGGGKGGDGEETNEDHPSESPKPGVDVSASGRLPIDVDVI